MTENSGNDPIDPHIVPAKPGREPLPGANGPAYERIFPPTSSAAAVTTPAASDTDRKVPEQKDAFRETVETIVFVVVLVLLLKAFMAEAFVIPTGSMATTLLGYHRVIECPECGFRFPLNLSDEKEQNRIITGCTCPNCRLHIDGTNSRQFPQ
jgi:Signal peptidase, peptidase S26